MDCNALFRLLQQARPVVLGALSEVVQTGEGRRLPRFFQRVELAFGFAAEVFGDVLGLILQLIHPFGKLCDLGLAFDEDGLTQAFVDVDHLLRGAVAGWLLGGGHDGFSVDTTAGTAITPQVTGLKRQ